MGKPWALDKCALQSGRRSDPNEKHEMRKIVKLILKYYWIYTFLVELDLKTTVVKR